MKKNLRSPTPPATRARVSSSATSSASVWHDRVMPRTNYRLLGGRSILSFDPSTHAKYTPNPRFSPEVAVKLIKAAQASDINVTALLSILVEKMPVDADGRPEWADEFLAQEGLPIDKA